MGTPDPALDLFSSEVKAILDEARTPRLLLIEAPRFVNQITRYGDALAAADQCGIREGETIAELIRRLYDETLDDDD